MCRRLSRLAALLCLSGLSVHCTDEDTRSNDNSKERDASTEPSAGTDSGAMTASRCADANGSLQLPDGFCASVFADGVTSARHLTVSAPGEVFVASAAEQGGVISLRDADDDGVAEARNRFGERGGTGIVWRNGQLYFAENARIIRYDLPQGDLVPKGEAVVIVADLPVSGDHPAKSIVFDAEGGLIVNIGSASNSCQEENRKVGSKGMDPCPELDERAGLWRFDATKTNQTLTDGKRIVTGARNATALALNMRTRDVWAVVNGRDQLNESFPDDFTPQQDEALPGEEMWPVVEGEDHGWPYCYFDPAAGEMRLAPEYGGNGDEIGRCNNVTAPATSLPAHWAPLGAVFYQGSLFPSRFQGGAFVAAHGSRFTPEPDMGLPGYKVVFLPWVDGSLGDYESFAEGFAGSARPLPDKAQHRPVGLAEGPDGALYIADDKGGRVWKVRYDAKP